MLLFAAIVLISVRSPRFLLGLNVSIGNSTLNGIVMEGRVRPTYNARVWAIPLWCLNLFSSSTFILSVSFLLSLPLAARCAAVVVGWNWGWHMLRFFMLAVQHIRKGYERLLALLLSLPCYFWGNILFAIPLPQSHGLRLKGRFVPHTCLIYGRMISSSIYPVLVCPEY